MMSDNKVTFIAMLITVTIIIAFGIGLMAGGSRSDSEYVTKAIEGGCAEYNKTTGEFQWIKREIKDEQ